MWPILSMPHCWFSHPHQTSLAGMDVTMITLVTWHPVENHLIWLAYGTIPQENIWIEGEVVRFPFISLAIESRILKTQWGDFYPIEELRPLNEAQSCFGGWPLVGWISLSGVPFLPSSPAQKVSLSWFLWRLFAKTLRPEIWYIPI